MLDDLGDGQAAIDIAIEHGLDEIDAGLAHDPGDAEFVVHDLVDAVKRVFLVHERVQQDAQRPHVLLLAAVRLALQHFGRGVIYADRNVRGMREFLDSGGSGRVGGGGEMGWIGRDGMG